MGTTNIDDHISDVKNKANSIDPQPSVDASKGPVEDIKSPMEDIKSPVESLLERKDPYVIEHLNKV